MSDLPNVVWRRSSYCSTANCVEVAHLGNQVYIRNSQSEDGPLLTFQQDEWAAFLEGARRGEFNSAND